MEDNHAQDSHAMEDNQDMEYNRFMETDQNGSIIILEKHRDLFICSLILLLVLATLKGIIFGYLLGKRGGC